MRTEDLRHINCFDKTNPRYKKGPRKYVCEEVYLVKLAVPQIVEKTKNAVDAKQNLAKKARLDSFNNRMERLDGIVPMPGLVSGDFCSAKTKRPKIGIRMLVKRGALWKRCLLMDIALSVQVQVFNWATSNNKLEITVPNAIASINHEQLLFDRIATAEGHRMLQFLNDTERIVLLRINPIFEDTRHGLPVKNMSSEFLGVCERQATLLNIPFERIVRKLEESTGSWVYAYMYRMTPRRVSCILAPHFHRPSDKKAMLIRDRGESFSRWGLPVSDGRQSLYFGVDYFGTDIVDVELYSASRYLSKHGLPWGGLEEITSRVMNEPGLTWYKATKGYVEKEILARQCRARENYERVLMRKTSPSGPRQWKVTVGAET